MTKLVLEKSSIAGFDQAIESRIVEIDRETEARKMATLDLIGSGNERFRGVLDSIDMVAPVHSAVLIQGEAGTRKEVVALAIHEPSARRKNRFVAINCAAIPTPWRESTGPTPRAILQRRSWRARRCRERRGDPPAAVPGLSLRADLVAVVQRSRENVGGTRCRFGTADRRIIHSPGYRKATKERSAIRRKRKRLGYKLHRI